MKKTKIKLTKEQQTKIMYFFMKTSIPRMLKNNNSSKGKNND